MLEFIVIVAGIAGGYLWGVVQGKKAIKRELILKFPKVWEQVKDEIKF